MPKPWEPGGSDLDWVDVEPRELEFWVTGRLTEVEVHFRFIVVPSWSFVIPDEWVRANLPPWLWTQPRPATFIATERPVIPVLEGVGFRHARQLSEVVVASPLSPAAQFEGPGPSGLGERVAREIESLPLTGVAALDDLQREGARLARELPVGELVRRLRGLAPLRGQTEHVAFLDDAQGPSLEARIEAVLRAYPHPAMRTEVIRERLGYGPDGGEPLAVTLAAMARAGRIERAPGGGWRMPGPPHGLEARILRIFEVIMPYGTLSFATIQLHLRAGGWEGQPGHLATAIGRLVEAGQLMADDLPGAWRLPQPAEEEPTGPRPPRSFVELVHRVLEGRGWVLLGNLYERMVAEGWEPPEIREGLDVEATRQRLLGVQARRLSTVETEGDTPANIRFRLRGPLIEAAGPSSEGRLTGVGVYHRELSAEEVAQIHEEGPSPVSFEAVAGLVREVAGEGPYPLLADTVLMILEGSPLTRAELLAFFRPLIPNVSAEHLDAALAVVLGSPLFVGRPENDGIRWELRSAAVPFESTSDTRVSEHLGELFPGVRPEEVAAGWRPNPAAPPGDYINIEAGPPLGETLLDLLEGVRVPPSAGSSYATLGSEVLAFVWGDEHTDWVNVDEIHRRLDGRRFWTAARVDEALDSGFRLGLLERAVRGGVIVSYRPIGAGGLRPTALERIVKGDPEL